MSRQIAFSDIQKGDTIKVIRRLGKVNHIGFEEVITEEPSGHVGAWTQKWLESPDVTIFLVSREPELPTTRGSVVLVTSRKGSDKATWMLQTNERWISQAGIELSNEGLVDLIGDDFTVEVLRHG